MGVLYATAVLGAAAFVLPWLWDNVVVVGRRLWATKDLPEPPGSLWLGHIPAFLQSKCRSFRCLHAWGLKWPVYRIRFFFRPVVVVTDPDLYQPLLRPGPAKLPKYTAPYRMFEVFTNPERANILTSPEHATWTAVRQAAVAALTMNNLRLCFPHITAVTQRLIESLSAAGPSAVHDMDAVAAAITVDVMGLAAFNRDLQATCTLPTHTPHNSNTPHHTSGATSNTTTTTTTSSSGQQCLGQEVAAGEVPLGSNSVPGAGAAVSPAGAGGNGSGSTPAGICGSVMFPRGREVLEVISHLVVAMQGRTNPINRWFPWRQARRDLFYWGGRMTSLVQDLTTSMEQDPPPPHSLGAHLMKAQYASGQPLDRNQIMAEIGIMWGAGFETTAHTICWTLFLLATHPEAEARLCAELDSLGLLARPDRPKPQALQWEHLAQLKYLSAVINESMRMYPAVSSGTIRITDKPINLGGHRLPAGQPVMMPFWAIHRSPRLWPDPDSFKPERFLPAEANSALLAAAAVGTQGERQGTAGTAAAVEAGGSSEVNPPGGFSSEGSVSSAAATAGVPLTAGGSGQGGLKVSEGLLDAGDGDEDYVDVAADIAAMRDQEQRAATTDKQQQQRKQQEPLSASSSASSSSSDKASRDAAEATAKLDGRSSVPRSQNLELKDPTVDRRGFLPFSIGSRNCVGQALALVELKAVLALLVGSFSFTLDPSMGGFEGVDASAKQTVTLRPEHGLIMRLAHRGGRQQEAATDTGS